MKKALSLIILFVMIASVPLTADSDLALIGMTGGYSSKDNTALLGFNGLYSYYASVDPSCGVGCGVKGDFLFGVNHPDDLSLSFSFLTGLALEFQFLNGLSLNFLLGPAVVAETGVTEPSVGIGVGLDSSLSYFIGEAKAIGFTIGVTAYPQFYVADDVRDASFSIMAAGYIGMALRFPASLIALPVLNYILD